MSLIVALFSGLLALAAATRAWAWWVRRSGLRTLGDAPVVRSARGVHVHVQVDGRAWRGLRPGRRHHERADLAVTADRMLLVGSSGILLDLTPERRVASVRAPGPGRLVFEGADGGADGTPTLYRIEAVVEESESWITELAKFAHATAARRAPPAP